jgi:hypothetical protein
MGSFGSFAKTGCVQTVHIGRRRLVVTESLVRYVQRLQGAA